MSQRGTQMASPISINKKDKFLTEPILQLTTPVSPGDLDTGKTYAFLLIRAMTVDYENEVAYLELNYVNAAGEIAPFPPPVSTYVIQDDPGTGGTDWTDLKSVGVKNAIALVFNEMNRFLYEKLLTIYPGTVVNV